MRAKPARALAAAVVCAASVTAAQPATALPTTTLTAAYSVTKSAVNASRNLVFTIYNGGMVQNYAVNHPLPVGLAFAGAFTKTCMSGIVDDQPIEGRSAVPAQRGPLPTATVYVEGNTVIGEPTCTITVPVTSATEAHYASCTADIQGRSGITTSFSCTHIWFEVRHPHRVAEAV
ncbi:hypothetical protein V5P93_005262 [Actinokineospora auranticolor]|uniref:Uncharacterized protein n=1 Tax=Actinokineospora auranticolor TaxID=155976 RepID=A0A2S6GD11_9PSEU|nr:hypothetical protein [Actinokineospora auranticolor]PPK63118.1 hypothetical protein CLV40_13251 [Actinokineospora auranticolor]